MYDDSSAASKAALYSLFNIVAGTSIVFANKSVFAVYHFKFTCALTWVHTAFTIVGLWLFRKFKFFNRKRVPPLDLAPLSLAYCGYIVLSNWNLNLNSVGFYQICKIAVAPTVLLIESVFYGKKNSAQIKMAVALVCMGVGAATVSEIGATPFGMFIGFLSIISTGLYQIWAGVEQSKRSLGSMQLLNEFSPVALFLLTLLTPFLEKVAGPDSLIDYSYTAPSIIAIVISSLLGIFVSLSTFLVIGATSSLTYNIVGVSREPDLSLSYLLESPFAMYVCIPSTRTESLDMSLPPTLSLSSHST